MTRIEQKNANFDAPAYRRPAMLVATFLVPGPQFMGPGDASDR